MRPDVVRGEDVPHVAQVLLPFLLPFQREYLADLGPAEQVLLAAAEQAEQGPAAAHVLLRVRVVEERLMRERDASAVAAQPAGADQAVHGGRVLPRACRTD